MSGIDHAQWQQLEPLLAHGLELTRDERARWLDDLHTTQPDLAERLRVLFEGEERADASGFLVAPRAEPTLIGSELGAYTIERLLGHGGMGSVWLARRTDGRYQGMAAVKILNLSLMSAQGQERFRREGTALARLTHPGIARLLDAGVSLTGQPYLVLEHVDGQPIDRYAAGLSVEAKVRLMLQVVAAVAHAHANLIVHRDLKPSNILVTSDGAVKLLDFGIAKLLNEREDSERAPLTVDGARVLTPEFASPEQVRGDPVTTATDVYALGVLLYVMLSGRHPTAEGASTPADALSAVLEVVPARLGLGDLDSVLTKALRTSPNERYQDVNAFGADLERWRRGHPVLARPDSPGYRARRFVARHRLGVTLSAAAVLVVVAAGIREVSLRSRAEAEASKAKAVENYLISVFDVADPFAPPSLQSGNVTARALLDRGAARVDSALAGHAENQAELRTVFGRVYSNLGLFDEAAAQQRRSLAGRKALYGPRHPLVAEAMDALGQTLVQQDKLDEAEPLLRDALAQRSAFFGTQDTVTATSIDHLALLQQSRNNFVASDSLFRQALAIRRAVVGPRTLAVANSLNNLGQSLFWKGAYKDAEPLYREALSIQEEILGPNHPSTAQTVQNLAQAEQLLRKIDEAEALYRRALAAKRKSLGNAHPSVTITLNNLGIMLVRERGDWQTAESLIREALALDRQMFGENHANVAASLDNLGTVLREKGDFAGAAQVYREALSVNEVVLGAKTTGVALGMNNVANVLRLEGKSAEAVPLLREAHALYTSLLGEKHLYTLTVHQNLAQALRESGKLREAERTFRDVAAKVDRDQPAQHLIFIKSQFGLGQALTDEGRATEALPLLEKGVEMAADKFGADHVATADARVGLGMCLLSLRQYDKAEPVLRAAYAVLEKKKRTQRVLLARAARALAQDYSALGKPEEARRYSTLSAELR
ncbi:MAG: serine/threonine-protein kinase [Gemmatimonadaceae bacterium]